jgi:hypothetical protein
MSLFMFLQIELDLDLKRLPTYLRKDMTDDLPLPSMFLPIPCIKQPPPDADERVVEIGLGEPGPVSVDDGNCEGGGD